MDLDDLARRLEPYGLEAGEAHLLYHLARLGPARAAEVAITASRARGETYRILDVLVAKGFAEKSLERPARYTARPLGDALQHTLEQQRSRLAGLEAASGDLVAAWPRPLAEAPSRQRYAVHQGSTQVTGLLERMVAGAREEILVATSHDGLGRIDAASFERRLLERHEGGLDVRVLARRRRDGPSPLTASRLPVRYGDLPTFYQAVLVDAREIALFVSTSRGGEDTVLWLNSSDVVLAQKALFDLAWAGAVTQQELAREESPLLQVVRGRWVRMQRLRELVRGARESVVLQGDGEEAARWAAGGLLSQLESRMKEGIEVRIEAPRPPGEAGPLRWEPASTAADGFLAVVDRTHVLVSPSLAAQPEEEWCLAASHPAVASRLWKPRS